VITDSIGVLNRGFDRAACRWNEAEGRAVFQGAPDTASLSVTFFWPFAGVYHVIALDQRDYRWALVCGPSRNYLSILARRADLSSEIKDRLIVQASGLGLPVENLILVDHSPRSDPQRADPGVPCASSSCEVDMRAIRTIQEPRQRVRHLPTPELGLRGRREHWSMS